MSSIDPNIGSILQSQISAGEAAKTTDTERNQRVHDSRQLARLADRQKHEVEDTDQTENVVVHRPGDQHKNGKQQRDTFEHEKDAQQDNADNNQENLCDLSSDKRNGQAPGDNDSQLEPDEPQTHIDLTA